MYSKQEAFKMLTHYLSSIFKGVQARGVGFRLCRCRCFRLVGWAACAKPDAI